MSFTIKENIENMNRSIEEAAKKSGRKREDITLMAVSKTMSLDKAIEAASTGVILGENYVQEFVSKYEQKPDLPWHFIGHLQKNKVKYIVGKAAMIHSVDSLELAEKINAEAMKRNITVSCLLEINAACENSKFGLTIESAQYIIKDMEKLENISVRGFMTVAPFVTDPEENRCIFRKMYRLFKECQEENQGIDTLSMGMSSDYTVAVEEGSTIVRIGTAIFGERNYNK
ncbi:MAG: YggS family pyridoxal phosphate-dependent enzyme [Bacillota bacterium]|nr:YggS family pyridoxal phosphate-dependent enzyme [Bacillota bacterium]